MTLPKNLPQTDYIQGFWRLDENMVGGGPAFDYSGNGNHLTDVNSVEDSASGKIGRCRDFELGNSEYLYITDANQTGLDITGDMTICAWIKPESIQEMVVVGKDVSGNRAYILTVNTSDKLQFSVFKSGGGESNIASTASLTSGTWYHICGVYNSVGDGSSIMDLYIDGISDASQVTNAVSPILDSPSWFGIGAREYAGSNKYFDGLIDEVIVWNTCLTAAEVLAVKNITAYSYGGTDATFLLNMMR